MNFRSMFTWILIILFLAINTSSALAASGLSQKQVNRYFIAIIFFGTLIALIVSLIGTKSRMSEEKRRRLLKHKTTYKPATAPLSPSPELKKNITALSNSLGKEVDAEKIMNLLNQEVEKKVTTTVNELKQTYGKVLNEKDRELKEISGKFKTAKQEYETVNTEKKHTESLVRSMADGLIIVNTKGEIELLNPAAQKILGTKSKDGLIGQKLTKNIKDEQLLSMLTGTASDKAADIELKSNKDETKTVVRANSAVIEDENGKTIGMVSVLSDITARKEIEEALRASEARLHKIIEKNADGMLIVTKEGLIRFVNQAAEDLFGRDKSKLIGMPCGFSVTTSQKKEFNIDTHSSKRCVVEMHAVEIEWEGENVFLVSLRDVTETVKLREILKELSVKDELTRLYNRRGFITLIEEQLKTAKETNNNSVLFFIDLDKMKEINDQLGHIEGDKALVDVSAILKESFKNATIIGRIGGDEFAIFTINTTDTDVKNLNTTLQKNIDSWNKTKNRSYNLSMSVGTAYYDPRKHSSIDDFIRQADQAMYKEKQLKRANR